MKCLSKEDRELIRRARRDGREAREMRKGRRERIEKGSHCFFKSSGYDKLELKHQNLVYTRLLFKKMFWHETEFKIYVPLVNRMS